MLSGRVDAAKARHGLRARALDYASCSGMTMTGHGAVAASSVLTLCDRNRAAIPSLRVPVQMIDASSSAASAAT